MLPTMARRRCPRNAGFTLVELMAVVLITGILAAIAVSLVRDHVNVAKSNRALAGIQAIRAAQEAFRAQNGRYLDCTVNGGWFPMATPGKVLYDWRQDEHLDWDNWQALGVARYAPTQFGYMVDAGIPGQGYPELFTTADPTIPAATTDWYVIQAKGDLDGDGRFYQAVATSNASSVYVEREGE
jgi:prepilin-type N-terminal cleavage/methylation domain-containing protein